MNVSKPQNMTPNATAIMAAVIRSTPRHLITGLVASTVLVGLREGFPTRVESPVLRDLLMCVLPSRGIRVAGCLGEASTRHTYRCRGTGGDIERKPEILNSLRRC